MKTTLLTDRFILNPLTGIVQLVTSGIRLGTNSLAVRGMDSDSMQQCVDLIHTVLSAVKPLDDKRYELPTEVEQSIQKSVRELCEQFPIPCYPETDG